jgi:iron only hydrogenase large subunit-like protein
VEEVKSRVLGLSACRQCPRHGLTLRKSHENPHVIKLYEEFLTDGQCGEQSHKYLHTHYTPRGDYLV